MKFHQHSTNNMMLTAPPGSKNVEHLPATMIVQEDASNLIASFWRPEPEELRTLMNGGSVVLYVVGCQHPPVCLGVVDKES